MVRPSSPTYDWEQLSSDTLQNITGGSSSFVFWAKQSKQSINFRLRSHQLGDNSGQNYEIVFGGWGNSKSVIRECTTCSNLEFHVEHNIISDTEFRPFWLSWDSGVISAGKGVVVGDQQFLSWTAPIATPPVVNYVSISPWKNSIGTWLFESW